MNYNKNECVELVDKLMVSYDEIIKLIYLIKERKKVIIYFGDNKDSFEAVLGVFVDAKMKKNIMRNECGAEPHGLAIRFFDGRFVNWCSDSIGFYGINLSKGTSIMYPRYFVLDLSHDNC